MDNSESQQIRVKGFLTGTIHSRTTKRKKGANLEGAEPYRSYYLSLDKQDVEKKELKEGSRVTLGIIRIEN